MYYIANKMFSWLKAAYLRSVPSKSEFFEVMDEKNSIYHWNYRARWFLFG